MHFTIYLLTSPNGKHYVGQTSQPIDERWKNGKGYKSCTALNRAIQKYGWENFKHEILAECDNQDEADYLEQKFILEYDCIVPNGYNIDYGGNANKVMGEETKGKTPWNKGKTGVYTDETRANMSAGMKGRPSPRKGVTLSEETKKKISEAKAGKPTSKKGKHYHPLSEETKRKLSEAHKGKPSKLKGKPWSEARRKAQERRKQCEA